MTTVVTSFEYRHPNGPTITATKRGISWTFAWPGKRADDEARVLDIDYPTAQLIAEELAKQVADMEPLRQELERRRDDLAEWITGQQEPTG